MPISSQGTLPAASADLSKFWDNYKPQIVGGLAGAGLGAAGLGGISALSDEEDPAVKSKNVRQNLALGAALGGLSGIGAGSLYKMNDQPEREGLFKKLLGFGLNSRAAQGAGMATGANALMRRHITTGWGKKPGGQFAGQTPDQLKDVMAGHIKAFKEAPLHTSPAEGRLMEQNIRDTLERMTANKHRLGRLSQIPAFRALGLNAVDPQGEYRAFEALQQMKNTPEGMFALQRILRENPASKGPSTTFPILEEALLGNGGRGNADVLRRSHALSGLGRLGTGAAAWSGVRGAWDWISKLVNPTSTEDALPQVTR